LTPRGEMGYKSDNPEMGRVMKAHVLAVITGLVPVTHSSV
jgi:hypothetical protein